MSSAYTPVSYTHLDVYKRQEVVHYDDLVSCGGKAGAREHGKLRIEGKELSLIHI